LPTLDSVGAVQAETRRAFPLGADESAELLEGLRERLIALHQAERAAAEALRQAVA
jgi:hypothetical protein